jgi:pimeloyl-ACP methyl ester carboxylesterase
METPEDRYVKVGKINARYWAEGDQGSPVVLIHGIGGSVESWLPTFGALATQHRVYAFDLLGQGRTDKPRDVSYGIPDLAQFVKDLMAALKVERAHVVGHSLGGAVGTRLAIMAPMAVDKLVLVSSAGLGKGVTLGLRLSSVPVLGEILTRPSRSGTARFARTAVYDPAVMTDELIEQQYQMASLPGMQQSFLRILRANGNVFGQFESMVGPNVRGLAAITGPVLVVWGRQDQVLPVAHAEVAARGLPNARLHIFDHCGHIPMLEHTQAFNELLVGFLGS